MGPPLGVYSQFAAGIRSQDGSDYWAAARVELGILPGCNFHPGGSLRLMAAEGNYWRMGSNSLVVGDIRPAELQGEAGLWAHMVAEVDNRRKHVAVQLLDLIQRLA